MWDSSRRNRLFAFLLLLALVCPLFAQNGATAAQPAKARKFSMWKVTSPTTTLYLVGSIHLASKDAYPLPDQVEKAFSASKVLVVEVDVRKIDQAAIAQLIQQYGLYPAGDSLANHISAETSAALEDFCKKFEVPCVGFQMMRPWMVSLMASVLPFQRAGADPKNGIDVHFLSGSGGIQRVEELETADYQVRVLASGTEQEQIEDLDYTLKNVHRVKELEAIYQSGNPNALVKMIEDAPKVYQKKLVEDRNNRMVERLDQYLKGIETCFVVIGAAHVVGDKGVAKLLETKNYKVEPMQFAW